MKMIKSSLEFQITTSDNCCGLFELGSFRQPFPERWERRNGKMVLTKLPEIPLKQVFNEFEKKVAEYIANIVIDYPKQGTYGAIITLIDKQLLEFQKYLLSTDWKIISSWKNQNTTNTIHLFHKVFSEEYMNQFKYCPYNDDEEEEW